MDKRLYLSLLLPLALAGCGGSDGDGGGGSKSTPKYNIDFASFYVQKNRKKVVFAAPSMMRRSITKKSIRPTLTTIRMLSVKLIIVNGYMLKR